MILHCSVSHYHISRRYFWLTKTNTGATNITEPFALLILLWSLQYWHSIAAMLSLNASDTIKTAFLGCYCHNDGYERLTER